MKKTSIKKVIFVYELNNMMLEHVNSMYKKRVFCFVLTLEQKPKNANSSIQ